MTRAEKRRRHLHWFCLITLVLAILYVWADIVTDLRFYQNANDDVVMKSFCSRMMSEARKGSCSKLLRDSNYKTNYYTLEHTGEILASVIEDKDVTYEVTAEDDSVYNIYADEELLGVAKLDISGSYGLLHLPTYSVVSFKATKSADYAVKSPSNTYIGDTSLQSLKPVQASLIFNEVGILSQSNSDIQIPEYLVYHVDELFYVPNLNAKGASSFYYPMTETESGLFIVEDYPKFEFSDDIKGVVESFTTDYASYISGYTDWEFLKGSIHSTGTLFTALEQKTGTRPAKPYEFALNEYSVSDFYAWTPSLFTVRVKYSYVTKGEGDVESSDDGDVKLYFVRNTDTNEWNVCEITDNRTLTQLSASAVSPDEVKAEHAAVNTEASSEKQN